MPTSRERERGPAAPVGDAGRKVQPSRRELLGCRRFHPLPSADAHDKNRHLSQGAGDFRWRGGRLSICGCAVVLYRPRVAIGLFVRSRGLYRISSGLVRRCFFPLFGSACIVRVLLAVSASFGHETSKAVLDHPTVRRVFFSFYKNEVALFMAMVSGSKVLR